MSISIRKSLLKEVMQDTEYSERIKNAKEWHEIIEVLREYCRKKGKRFMEIYA